MLWIHGLITDGSIVVLELLCAQTVRVGVLEYGALKYKQCVQSSTHPW
jgi:hypothetical protein